MSRTVLFVALALIFAGVGLVAGQDLAFFTPTTHNEFGYSWTGTAPSSQPLSDFVTLSDSDADVLDLTSSLPDDSFHTIADGNFSFPFYGETYSLIILASNGVILFGEQYGLNGTSNPGDIDLSLPDCGLPQAYDPKDTERFVNGFAFAWADFNFGDRFESSRALVKIFGAGECPFEAKKSESCLVVSFLNAPYYVDRGAKQFLGDATAILFESGDMLTQVRTYSNSSWGVVYGAGDGKGVVFGIQSANKTEGFTAPNNGSVSACEALNTPGWEDKADLIKPGDSFQIFFAAPCDANKGERTSYSCNGAGVLSAAWLETVMAGGRALLRLFLL